MILGLGLFLLAVLGVVAIIDFKFKEIPSMFLTGIILVVFIVQTSFELSYVPLIFGVASFIYAYLLYESRFVGGVADIKVMIIIGLMISSTQHFIIFMLLVLFYGLIFKLTSRYLMRRGEMDLVAFIPCLYAVYITLLLNGVIV